MAKLTEGKFSSFFRDLFHLGCSQRVPTTFRVGLPK